MNNNYPNSNASRGSIDELIDLAKKEELNNNYFEAIRLYSLAIKKNNERNDNSYIKVWFCNHCGQDFTSKEKAIKHEKQFHKNKNCLEYYFCC